MGKRRTRATSAERGLISQIKDARSCIFSEKDELPIGNLADRTKMLAHISRLSADLEKRKAARLAGAESDPVKRLELLRDLAEADGSWVAAARYGKDSRDLTTKAEKEAEDARIADVTRQMTPEEHLEAVEDAARNAPMVEIEIVVAEWLERLDLELWSDEGTPQIRRIG